MKETTVAIRYAKAMLESFKEPSILDDVNSELWSLSFMLEENHQLRVLMQHPAIPHSIKSGVLDEIVTVAGLREETGKALRVILNNGRITLLKNIAMEFEKLVFETLGRVRVKVISAMKLNPVETDSLKEILNKMTGKQAVVDIDVDTSLIGGVVVKIGSLIYDGSVKNQLMALRVQTN